MWSRVMWPLSPFLGLTIMVMSHNVNKTCVKDSAGDFPGGAVVESPPADAGDVGSYPGLGGSHMLRSGWTREPWPLGLRIQSLCSATGEATAVRGPRTV